MGENFILKGNLCWAETPSQWNVTPSGFLVCLDGRSAGAFPQVPERYSGLKIWDYGDRLIIPGMVDLHLHAPQYSFRGLRMDLELLDWLECRAFPEEAKYRDPAYAEEAYRILAEDLRGSVTTRACIFATVHRPATLKLMDRMEETGLVTCVGKLSVNYPF